MFFSYCGPGTFLAFALMTLAILPIALVYSEISPLFHTAGGELIYNTVGFNRHVGFLASWLIMAAWISVPPAVVMAIVTFISRTFGLGLTFGHTMIIGIIILVAVFLMSMQDIQFLVKAQAVCLFANITTTLLTGVLLLFSGHWSFANVANLFQTNLEPSAGIPGWIIGMALLITPFFGFETVPQMVEEGDFPTSNTKKAICGSVLTCGTIYVFFFCVAGLDSFQTLLSGDAQNGFMTITAMQNLLGWKIWSLIYGCVSILMGMTASILGFWMSTARMLYSMGKKNFLPEIFTKVNTHQQPILPNLFLLGISLTFILLQNATTFMNDFFNLMSFGCAWRIRSHHGFGCAHPPQAPRMVQGQQECCQGRRFHPDSGYGYHAVHRLLLHPGPGPWFLDLLRRLYGRRRCDLAVDGRDPLEKIGRYHRNSRWRTAVLSL